MNSKYKTIKYKKNKPSNIEDLVSIEEPLEMVVRYKNKGEWIDNSISITMRTPKNDEDLIVGLLFCEGIVQKISEIEKIEFLGDKVGKFDLQNKIRVTLNSGENLDLKHLTLIKDAISRASSIFTINDYIITDCDRSTEL